MENLTRQNRKQMTTHNTPKANRQTHQTKITPKAKRWNYANWKNMTWPADGNPPGIYSHIPPAPPEALGGANSNFIWYGKVISDDEEVQEVEEEKEEEKEEE
jgi:hypothetical protein